MCERERETVYAGEEMTPLHFIQQIFFNLLILIDVRHAVERRTRPLSSRSSKCNSVALHSKGEGRRDG